MDIIAEWKIVQRGDWEVALNGPALIRIRDTKTGDIITFFAYEAEEVIDAIRKGIDAANR